MASSLKRADTLDIPVFGPGGPMDIVFSFDTTYSMLDVLKEVRAKVEEVINRLFTDMPNLQIGVFGHGDYDSRSYITKYIDLTNNITELRDFVRGVEDTVGYTVPECYELVLKEMREKISWRPGSQRAIIMIGDTFPHNKAFYKRERRGYIDWKDEVDKLKKMNVTTYAVQAYEHSDEATVFWTELADRGRGKHLNLTQFESIVDIMMGICYREQGPEMFEAYEKEVREREGAAIRDDLHSMLLRLKDRSESIHSVSEENTAADMSMDTGSFSRKYSLKRAASKGDEGDSLGSKKRKVTISLPDSDPKPPRRKSTARVYREKQMKTRKVVVAQRKLRREDVPENNFMLNELNWTPWKSVVEPVTTRSGQQSKNWKGFSGVRGMEYNSAAFQDSNQTTFYEVAVQPKERAKRYPVYYSTPNSHSGKDWVNCLLHKEARSELDKVVRNSCKVFIRKAEIPRRVKVGATIVEGLEEMKDLVSRVYDYPWCPVNDCKTREVFKAGVPISTGPTGDRHLP